MVNEEVRLPYSVDNLLQYDEAKRFVPSTDLWYAYSVDDVDRTKLKVSSAEIEYKGDIIETVIVTEGNYILSAAHCDINDLLAAMKDTDYELPKVQKIGYIDEVDRMKYISVPVKGYWDLKGHPILMIKGKV